jgi:hypothetical protein
VADPPEVVAVAVAVAQGAGAVQVGAVPVAQVGVARVAPAAPVALFLAAPPIAGPVAPTVPRARTARVEPCSVVGATGTASAA